MTDSDDSQYSRGRKGIIFTLIYHFPRLNMLRHLFVVLHLKWLPSIIRPCTCDYEALLWLDWLNSANEQLHLAYWYHVRSYTQVVDLNSPQLSFNNSNRRDWPRKLTTSLLPIFVSKDRSKFGWLEDVIYFDYIEQILFNMSNSFFHYVKYWPITSLCKIPTNNFIMQNTDQ